MNCEFFGECTYPCNGTMTQHLNSTQLLVEYYCKDNPLLCARRRIAMTVGSEEVPCNLRPDQSHRILDVVSEAIGRTSAACLKSA